MKDGPKPFRLLGEEIVLFLAEGDAPAALEDRCRHRTAHEVRGGTQGARLRRASGSGGRLTAPSRKGAEVPSKASV